MAQTGESSRRSCVECHRRKIKCDKSLPCAYCVKVRIECRYPPPKRSQEKVAAQGGNPNSNVDVISRIDKIERTLESFERTLSQISQLVLPNSLNTPTSIDLTSNTKAASPEADILSLWQIFLQRVDPVLKIIHVPTVQQKIVDVVTGRHPASVEVEALIGSICYSAVITASVEECQRYFTKDREELLNGYRIAVANSLQSANHLTSTDMIPLQAFVISIVCGRFDKWLKGSDVKDLLSIAINIARRNGLHNVDGDETHSPFENEMRRRIWWQLYTLDVRNAEDNGLDPYIREHWANRQLPQLPQSINDINLHPDMRQLPQPSAERTEMLFTLDRHEISTLARRLLFSDEFCQQNSYPVLSASEKCDEIDKFQAKIESQILGLCNPDIPIDYITVTSSRLVLAKLKLGVMKPKTRENQHIITQEGFRRTCVDILKSTRELSLYENGKQWLWLFQTYLEWDALAYLFINLSLIPSGQTINCAWQAAEDIYQYWKNHGEVVFGDRWSQIENLRSQALLAKQMYQENPASFPEEMEFQPNIQPNVQPNVQPTDQRNIQENLHGNFQPNELANEQNLSTGPFQNTMEPTANAFDIPVPTAETECQWSAALFDRYFQVLDMDHSMELSWL
ncbi:hypothetical protein N7456_000265 [Penicillium angulare]|uniref:Zn(2)-C6 fungal-type domain-containing protein n=1 Tax=Penicillium angulare TaxID=116970 RepID=A0A9W9GBT2_9EURO|nr:hypothetical protein N7456_000265 [Penicillium angulare]